MTSIADKPLEAMAIGAALTAPDVAEDLASLLSVDDFSDMKHRGLWEAIVATAKAGQCDVLTVAAACPGVDRADLVGLMQACPSPELGLQAAEQLQTLRNRRELHTIGMALAAAAADRSTDPEDAVAEAVRGLSDATRIRAGAVTIADAMPDAMDFLERLRDGDPEAAGLSTGFTKLDRYMRLRAGELTIVGARPSVGKSAFLLTVALNVARAGHPALLVSCEMSARELVLRALPAFSGVPVSAICDGAVSAATWALVEDAERELCRLPLRFYDRGRCKVGDIAREAKAMQRSGGLGLVLVDYIGLLTPVRTPRTRTKENEVAELSGDLKALAMNLHVPVIVASQLNREVENKKLEVPTLRHLRDSGAIEQDADNVLLLHRDRDESSVRVIVAKQRNGQGGLDVTLAFSPKLTQFSDTGPVAEGF